MLSVLVNAISLSVLVNAVLLKYASATGKTFFSFGQCVLAKA